MGVKTYLQPLVESNDHQKAHLSELHDLPWSNPHATKTQIGNQIAMIFEYVSLAPAACWMIRQQCLALAAWPYTHPNSHTYKPIATNATDEDLGPGGCNSFRAGTKLSSYQNF